MANGYSTQALAAWGTTPPQMVDGGVTNAERRTTTAVITGASLVSQGVGAIGDTILVGKLPMGSQFVDIQFQSDTVLTGATLAWGYGTTQLPASIVSSTTFGSQAAPAANTLYTLRPVAQRVAGQLTADQFVFITISGAALPSSFNLEIAINYQMAN